MQQARFRGQGKAGWYRAENAYHRQVLEAATTNAVGDLSSVMLHSFVALKAGTDRHKDCRKERMNLSRRVTKSPRV